MTPFYTDDWLTLYGGDCRTVLSELPADSVDCVVTSPPYWGLRDYGTATWVGGDEACDHEPDKRGGRFASLVSEKQRSNTGSGSISQRDCKCGATRVDSQLGLERTPEEYVANMVAVFRAVWRVLKPSGTCWLNLGDSYAGSWGAQSRPNGNDLKSTLQGGSMLSARSIEAHPHRTLTGSLKDTPNLKPKDLVGIPWRVAFALQADGWYLRSDIIWSKPNPMPESVTDRPTKSHEYLFLLTKSARYYFDADAVAEASVDPPGVSRGGALSRFGPDEKLIAANAHRGNKIPVSNGRRNIRSVWSIATRPYPGAHFAVFPPELPERCIKAGSPTLGTVLDPFGGSGTVGMVANRLSRRAILIDLNPEYLQQQMRRNAQTPLGLTEGDAA